MWGTWLNDGLARVRRALERTSRSRSLSNVEYNRHLWDGYARRWDPTRVPLEDGNVGKEDRPSYVRHLGDEWGRVEDVDRIVAEYIFPFVTPESIVAEIGVGGGRIAARVAPRTKVLYGFDTSPKMLAKARVALAHHPNVILQAVDGAAWPARFVEQFDFVYAFDVLVHLDLHTLWKCFCGIGTILKPGGKAFIHTTNLTTAAGWERFARQAEYSVEGHYFISPEMVKILAERSTLKVVRASSEDPTNFYLKRDYLAVLEKPGP